jgi:hypothetical protein
MAHERHKTREVLPVNLVLIETSGNQAYIFATNKLRENVGASELTARVGTRFVLAAVRVAKGQRPQDLRKPDTYPALSDTNPVEVILAVSGKALLLVRDKDIGKQIVRAVTLRALRKAPGLEVRGVVSREFDFDEGRPASADWRGSPRVRGRPVAAARPSGPVPALAHHRRVCQQRLAGR